MIVYILIALLIVAVAAGSLAVERFMNGTRNAARWYAAVMVACALGAAVVGVVAVLIAGPA